jgi:DMSO reductase family type II enzyme heme b subunit
MNACRMTILVLLSLAVAGCGGEGAGPGELPAKELRAARVEGDLPGDDPFASSWDQARDVIVPLLVQDVAEPRLTEKGVETLRVRALHDGQRIAILLTWEDDGTDDLVDVDRSADGVAIQFPATGGADGVPDAMMGEEGKPVAISLWKASWQRRVDGGTTGIAALYPNAAIDHYPPEAAKDPTKRAQLTKLYEPPVAVKNPVAAKEWPDPVEDLVAEGFGTLAHAEGPGSTGRGVRKDGRWHVVIARPLDLAAGAKTNLRPGQATYIAFAVWNGARDNRGSKKMRSIWVPLEITEVSP